MSTHIYNHIKDEPDSRDLVFTPYHSFTAEALPPAFDLRITGFAPSIIDQGPLGSCGPCQASQSLKYCLKRDRASIFQPSRLFIYYFTRLVDGSPVNEDTGVTIRSLFKSIKRYGAPHEHLCPYDIRKFAVQPSKTAMADARHHIPDFSYIRVPQNLTLIKQALLVAPIVLGIDIYDSFENEIVMTSGEIPVPDPHKESLLGGHAVSLYGWDDHTSRFIMMNTWGTDVGQQGWFTIPYEYVLNPNLADSLWTVRFFS